MAQIPPSAQEWRTIIELAGRLGIDFSELTNQDVTFSRLESSGHRLGRAVAQVATERLSLA